MTGREQRQWTRNWRWRLKGKKIYRLDHQLQQDGVKQDWSSKWRSKSLGACSYQLPVVLAVSRQIYPLLQPPTCTPTSSVPLVHSPISSVSTLHSLVHHILATWGEEKTDTSSVLSRKSFLPAAIRLFYLFITAKFSLIPFIAFSKNDAHTNKLAYCVFNDECDNFLLKETWWLGGCCCRASWALGWSGLSQLDWGAAADSFSFLNYFIIIIYY